MTPLDDESIGGESVGVVIPAWNEASTIAGCLGALLDQSCVERIRVEIVVVANGCTDDTAAIARRMAARSPEGFRVQVLEVPQASKAAALNAGEQHLCRTIDPIATVYLDADIVVSGDAIASIVEAADTEGPRCISPYPLVCLPRYAPARSYARVWQQLPRVRGDVIGGGCYAVNRCGRQRWRTFPELVADDGYVRSRFAPDERVVLDDAYFMLRFPDGPDFVRTLARWRRGNRELHDTGNGFSSASSRTFRFSRRAPTPSVWRHVPTFLIGSAASMWRARSDEPWLRDRDPLRPSPPRRIEPVAPVRPRIDAVVVTYESEADVGSCLRSLRHALGARGEIHVVDNGSTDGTAAALAEVAPSTRSRVEIRTTNVGFAAAVNATASRLSGDYLLLVNPDVVLEPDAVDALVRLARMYPGAGLYGGQAFDPVTSAPGCSSLPAPSVPEALMFASGMASLRARSGHASVPAPGCNGESVQAARALVASVVLISREAWRDLGGFDDRYFMYCEDVDLCLRASGLGYTPMFTPSARYTHVEGASSAPDRRLVMLLTGRASLYRAHLPATSARAAIGCLLAGVALRAIGESFVRRTLPPKWRVAWGSRRAWRDGWSSRS